MMMHSINRLGRRLAVATAGAGVALAGAAGAQDLPDTMTWTSYDVGSAGYAEASAMADALGREYGTRIRIQPSGSSIGRLQPVVQQRAQYGFLATETWFATEGVEDFAARQWGPQDLRVLAGRPAAFGMPTAADAGIDEIADVEGKRVAFVAGNPSVNVKCEAILSFAGLTKDDVEVREFPTYGGAMSSLAAGDADATCTTTTPSQLYELAESPRGIHWVELPSDNEQGWERLREVAPFFAPYEETKGAGISEDNPVQIMAYRYPMIVARADTSADEVYSLVKALDETYDMYKDATAVMSQWDLDESGVPPADAPFHEGAIRYLREQGIWTEEHDEWNETRLERLRALQDAWQTTMDEAAGKSEDEFNALWEEHRQRALDSL
ncbi:TAXI family TRAP transporter solute-binding subunit [Aquisalimonas lutea]|uniref:TAXI family TRAP transporter solute-binding subunit n=1 Tax=Aquisalimonas lutea TaxID=1327750 RepID=UPI0025B3359E|nr:TAXI family TRAP transporter solute-binding subunit [Aquisalimonas lutea]MDN3516547.1 TAXI family TRAP transporter solute-binding subunit [Aquisalimonas lutea]